MTTNQAWRIILVALAAAAAAPAVTLTLLPQGDVTGTAGATVGWGFTITNTTNGQWIEITSANFCTGTSGTNTACTATSLGTFTDFVSAYNDVVVGASPDATSVTQSFNNGAHTGIGSFRITASSGQTGAGQLVLTYNVFSRSPHNASFNPDTDTVSTDNFLTAAASVTVVAAPPPATPVPPSIALTLTGLFVLGGWQLCRRRRKVLPRHFGTSLFLAGLLLTVLGTAHAQPNWVPAAIPPFQRVHAAMAYDPVRGQTVMHGGDAGTLDIYGDAYSNETWLFDGFHWTKANPLHKPPARQYSAMAFDPVRQQMILYGGAESVPGQNGFTGNDTWAWDGTDWTELYPTHNPGAIDHHLMTTDTGRSRIVLFNNNQTWEWDGSDWTQKYPLTSPPTRWMSAMAYDEERKYTVLFGGRTQGTGATDLADTWLWDGTNWTLAGMFHGPPARSFHNMIYDAELRQVLIIAGINPGTSFYNDVWGWDGLKWNQLVAACRPCANPNPILREGAVADYDSKRRFGVLYGGLIQAPSNSNTLDYLDDTWLWYGTAWTARSPLHRQSPSIAWDTGHQQAVMFGGWAADYSYSSSVGETNETWVWDGAVWAPKNPAHKPSPRQQAGMVYDEARQQVLLFGGLQGSTIFDDMWAWDGSDWTQLTPATLPSARQGALMAYDALNQRVVLFGGNTATTSFTDTWVWNGTAWTQLSPATVPPSSSGFGMAYDPVRQRVMLTENHSSWYFDASNNWTALAAPPVTFYGVMAWDGALADMVYLNAWSGCCSQMYNMFTFNGSSWAQITPATMPTKRNDTPIVYDPVRSQVMLYGGNLMDTAHSPYPTSDTWVFTTPVATGDIYVQTNATGAFYTITGPATYSGSGTSSHWTGVTPGSYTITYGSAPGYSTPNSETQTLTAGSSIGFTTNYPVLPGVIQVTSNVATTFNISGPIQYSGSGTSFTKSNVLAGTYTISFVPVAGYVTPASQTQTLAPGGQVGFTATYTALPTTCILTVGTNVAAATFSVVGPAGYYGSGTSYSQSGIPPGTYTITYDAVAGYRTPAQQTSSVSSGGALAFTGTYQLATPPTNVGWVLKSPAPSGRAYAAAVYDTARQQVVMFGGTRGNATNETWVYDGAAWTRKTPAHSPPAQQSPMLAYDAARQKVVLAGIGATYFDTWTWDGTDWTQMSPATNPPTPDNYSAIAYDAARQQTVLILSFDTGIQAWAWDGTNWSQKAGFGSNPSYYYRGYATFDGARNQVVLVHYGYVRTGGAVWTLRTETWVFDGTTWTLKATSASSSVPPYAPLVWDQARQQVVTFDTNAATWVWDGAAWTNKAPATSPSKRTDAPSLVFDPATSKVWMIGGLENGTNLELSNDIWAWDGTNWTQKAATPAYPVRNTASMVYDPAHGETVQFGGYNTASMTWVADTWTWNGSTWTQKNPATVPYIRSDFPMVFDSARQQVVMFGGDGYYLYLNDTWVWDGTNWNQKKPTNNPPNRRGNMMAYDAAHGVAVMFGGLGYSGVLNDTWTWNGTNWTQMTPANSPPARELGAMTYDSARGKVVLFGGQDASSVKMGDTWEWDGTNWTQRTPATSPAARCAASAVYDTLRGYALLYGGNTSASGYLFQQDTWSWDGTNWTPRTSADTPPAAIVGIAYDAARGQVVTFGGWSVAHYFAEDVWVWDQLPTQPTTGTINVTTNLTGASFSLTGAATYTGSGTAWSQTNAPAGSYTITYNAVTGYTTPPPQTLTLAAGATIAFTGTYTAVVSQFAVSAPASATVGTAFNFTVTAKDATNNTMTGYTGTVHFTSNDTAATLPADAALTNGSGTFSATLRTAGTRSITATDTVTATIVGTSGGISVGASVAGLNISVTHTGNFTQGDQNDTYSVTVSNGAAAAPTSGTVTVTETIPVGLTLVSMAGTGWTCAGGTCSRADALAAGTAWPPITVTVNIGINALSPQVNQVSLSGGGSAAASATDSTVVNPMAGGAAVLFGTIAGKQGTQAARVWTFSIGNSGTGAAAAAQITGLALTQTAGAACTPVVTSPASFPLTLGNIPAGAFAQTNMTINFTGCANAALFMVQVQLSANGGSATAVILRNDEER